ncbi:hypothetical protein EAO75_30205 [Streptomyces sp. uw30]|uniref:hypothetical protein n=1 Tax=Streptomyces sp. uw30 TaxID=1828179 RepID=UPI0011CED163|nr:hypothetical protein [Streptomyces sp. uw30]TXS44081.1 hypothetical protein EAO75_30205 [Streptomyces sp. uw30]
MTYIHEMISRALLVRDRTVPRDIVPPSTAAHRRDASLFGSQLARESACTEAAEDLRTLCETLVTHMPATFVAEFVTDQVPEPRSALVLACVLQLTDTDDGARYWWQYAAGAGQPAAAYCLYLHHLSLGERAAAAWWHRQTDDVQPPPEVPARAHSSISQPVRSWFAHDADTSATSILSFLLHVAKYTARPRPAAVTELMAYVPLAVAAGYLRQPDAELPLPGTGFARKIRALLPAAANRRRVLGTVPAQPDTHVRAGHDSSEPQCANRTTENSPAIHS